MEQNSVGYVGTESVFVGDRSGGAVSTGSFDVVVGHNAAGIGGSCGSIYLDSATISGTDAMRDTCGSSVMSAYGASALGHFNQVGTLANHYGWGLTSLGASSMFNWNGAVSFPFNTAIGDSSCYGAAGASFTGITCIGATSGTKLTTASNSLLVGGGGGGGGSIATGTFASGSGVILIGSGNVAVDTPAAGTSNYINVENILTVTGTNAPATSVATIAGGVVMGVTTVAGLPTCNGSSKYLLRMVSDLNSPAWNATASGSGSVPGLVLCDGTNWKVR